MDRHSRPWKGERPAGRRLSSMLRAAAIAAAALCLGNLSGCQILTGVLYMVNGPPRATNPFTKFTKKRLSENGKRVVVLSSSTGAALSEHPSLDVDMIDEVTRRFKIENVNVVAAPAVSAFVDDIGGIRDETPLDEIGLKFRADYIVLLKFEDFGYREANSPTMYRGHARGKVVAVEMVNAGGSKGKKRAKVIWNIPFDSKFPLNGPITADQEGPDVFQSRYLQKLSQELALKFCDPPSDGDMF
jgi:hypothetical protein